MAEPDRNGAALRTHAFGIAIESSFEVPGLVDSPSPADLPRTALELRTDSEVDASWQPRDPLRLAEETFGTDTVQRTIDYDSALGYRLYAKHFGLALISPDGAVVKCAPPDVSPWQWQRFLVGRVLPWASLLQGREVIHASAVRLGDRIVAFVAPSGMGKSSLGLRMVLRGAGFVTDDVLAVSRENGRLLGHPGAGIVAVRESEMDALGPEGLRQLGQVLGTSGKTYVAVPRENEPLEIGAVYFLSPRDPSTPAIQPGAPVRQLLGSAFISSVTSPARLEGLLDICATLSRGTPLFQLGVDASAGADELAGVIQEHAAETIGG